MLADFTVTARVVLLAASRAASGFSSEEYFLAGSPLLACSRGTGFEFGYGLGSMKSVALTLALIVELAALTADLVTLAVFSSFCFYH